MRLPFPSGGFCELHTGAKSSWPDDVDGGAGDSRAIVRTEASPAAAVKVRLAVVPLAVDGAIETVLCRGDNVFDGSATASCCFLGGVAILLVAADCKRSRRLGFTSSMPESLPTLGSIGRMSSRRVADGGRETEIDNAPLTPAAAEGAAGSGADARPVAISIGCAA